MARRGRKNKAHINKQLWDRSNSTDRSKWRSKSQKGYDFYLDEQLSMDEEKSLEESGMPSFTINRILPIVEIMKYFVTANSPRWKAVGATGDDTDIAQVHSDISDYCWHLSNGNSIYGQVVLDSLVKGVGYFLVDVDQDADHGKGEVTFSRIDPYDVFVDPSSRDFLFRDAAFIMIKKNLSKSQLKNLFPQHAAKINKINASSDYSSSYSQRDLESSKIVQPEDVSFGLNPENAEEDQIIPYYENYTKIKVPFVNAFIRVPLTTDQEEQLKQSVDVQLQEFTDESAVQLQEKIMSIDQSLQAGEIIPERAELEVQKANQMMETAIAEKQQELMSIAQEEMTKVEQVVMKKEEFDTMMNSRQFKSSVVDFVNFFETRIKLCCSVGDDVYLYEYELPITEYPIIPIPYLYTGTPYPMSAVMPLIGKQQEINKAHQIMVHNANLASNLRWLYEEGSVDESEWEQYSSSPGALLKYRQGFQPPTPVLPAPINSAFYSITQEGKADAEYISGVPSAMMGFTQQQAETYRGLLANDEFGTRRLKSWMATIVEPALEHLGKCFQMVSQKHYQIDKVFRIVQPNAGKEEDDKEIRINIPIFNDYGKAIGKWMDYESGKFDIRIIAGATLPLNRWALLEEYFKWYQAGLIDDIAMIAETDIRNKKQLVNRKSVYSQLQSQLQQMEEAVKDKDGTIETLQRQLVQAGIKMKVGEASQQVNKELVDTEGQQKLLRSMMQGEFQMAKRELSRELKAVVEQAKIDTKKDFDASKEK